MGGDSGLRPNIWQTFRVLQITCCVPDFPCISQTQVWFRCEAEVKIQEHKTLGRVLGVAVSFP